MFSVEKTLMRFKLFVILLILTHTTAVPPTPIPTSFPTMQNIFLGYYQLDSDVLDSSGNGQHCTNSGATSCTGKNGVSNTAFCFNGVSQQMNCGFSAIPAANIRTLAVWVSITAFPSSYAGIVTKSATAGGVEIIAYSASKFQWDQGAPWLNVVSGTLQTSTWYHVVGTQNGPGQPSTLYINGVQVSQQVYSASSIVDATNLIFGGWNGGGRNLNGAIDNVLLLNRPLSAGEVNTLFQATQSSSSTFQDILNILASAPSSQPSSHPSSRPTRQPTRCPTGQPTSLPSSQPSNRPSNQPSCQPNSPPSSLPSSQPTDLPTRQPSSSPSFPPTVQPTDMPTNQPTSQPTGLPFARPTAQPSSLPSSQPSSEPSSCPTAQPSTQPSQDPSSQPTGQPVSLPTSQPTVQPSSWPTRQPSTQPTNQPSTHPSRQPSGRPTSQPSRHPSSQPSRHPSSQPTSIPTTQPSSHPSPQPTVTPSVQPSCRPSNQPTSQPSSQPTRNPSSQPSSIPSKQPSTHPSVQPTVVPTRLPSAQPSSRPSSQPTSQPSSQPSVAPSSQPTKQPSSQPTSQPSSVPTGQPTTHPTRQPSGRPTDQPSSSPSSQPSRKPIANPTRLPTSQPSFSPSSQPSLLPTNQPTAHPTSQPTRRPSCQPTNRPTSLPTQRPSSPPSAEPSLQPTTKPTNQPSSLPSTQPTQQPSSQPTTIPSRHPTGQPAGRPSHQPSSSPSSQPTCVPTFQPSNQPTGYPTCQPSSLPSCCPSSQPSVIPSKQPSSCPSNQPTAVPTRYPSGQPSTIPSSQPTSQPSIQPSGCPSRQPTTFPSSFPSCQPTTQPNGFPSSPPTEQPSDSPSSQPTMIPSNQPTNQPTVNPGAQPTTVPSVQPSSVPSTQSTSFPSNQPTSCPSSHPSLQPFSFPSTQPTDAPTTQPTSFPTVYPSSQPISVPSHRPVGFPTSQPTRPPTSQPSKQPITLPTAQPTTQPSSSPSSSRPTGCPTVATKAPLAPSITSSPTTTCKPTRMPSFRPTRTPTIAPTAFLSVVPNKRDLQGILFSGGSFPFYQEEAIIENIDLTNYADNHESFIIFGQNQKKIHQNINVATSRIVTKYVHPILSRESNENIVRSVTVVGDINKDGFPDLVIGYRVSSLAIVYFGKEDGFTTLRASFTIYGERYTEFGWAVSGLGDVNGDSMNDFMISAKAIGTIYIFFGKQTPNSLYAESLTAKDGFKIVGTAATVNTGVALAHCGDFNNDGHNDILFSTQTRASSQGIIYILFGNNESTIRNISMDHLESSTAVLTIIAPTFRLSGLSLAGVGDINIDGYNDIVIGSLPFKGISPVQSQTTYLVYGRPITGKRETLELTSMREGIDGITITGAGFMVTGPGDLNGDRIADLVIVNYPSWQGKFGSYFIQYPENITSFPTLSPTSLPSSQPSALPSLTPTIARVPSNRPTVLSTPPPTPLNETNPPIQSRSPSTVRPTLAPKQTAVPFSPTEFPALPPTFSPTRLPSASPVPSYLPTLLKVSSQPSTAGSDQTRLPTVDFRRLRASSSPSRSPTAMPTINATNYIDVYCSKAGVTYQGKNDTHYKFVITLGSGTVQLVGNEDGGAKNLFVLQSCPSDDHRVNVVIKNFRLSTDILSVAHLPSGGYSSMSDLTYSLKAGQPLTFLFCPPGNKLQVIMSSHTSFDLAESNFLFSSISSAHRGRTGYKRSSQTLMFVQIGFVYGVIVLVLVICGVFAYQNKIKIKEDEKLEELFFRRLLIQSEKNIERELEMDSWEENEVDEEAEGAAANNVDEDLSWFEEHLEAEERLREDDTDNHRHMIIPVSHELNSDDHSRDQSLGSEPVGSQEYSSLSSTIDSDRTRTGLCITPVDQHFVLNLFSGIEPETGTEISYEFTDTTN
jgi:hypothetical protein